MIIYLVILALVTMQYCTEGLQIALSSQGRQARTLRLQRLYASDSEANVADDTVDKPNGSYKVELNLVSTKDKGDNKYMDEGTQYIMCSQCKSSYVYDEEVFGTRGRKVKCGVCNKEWFQSGTRVLTTDKSNSLMGMTEEKVAKIRSSIEMRNWPRFPKTDKIGIFVGNLPYNYDEKEIGEIFAEYGITNISLVRDPTGLSKGFAFIETADPRDAEKMIDEMHHFNTDEERRLTVRLATQPGQRSGGGGGREGRSGERKIWQKRER